MSPSGDSQTMRSRADRGLRQPSAATALIAVLAACVGDQAPADRSIQQGEPPVEPLSFLRSVVSPDTTLETDWLSTPTRLRVDPTTRTLLVMGQMEGRVVEFSTAGQLIRHFGEQGSGPGEIRLAQGFAITTHVVIILDAGNGKIAVFDRSSGDVMSEIRLNHLPYDIAAVDDSLIALVPGTAGHAFALYALNGREVGQYAESVIPNPCYSCQIVSLAGDLIVITDGEGPLSYVFDQSGNLIRTLNYREMIADVAVWEREFAELLEVAGDRGPAGRILFADNVRAANGRMLLTVVPEKVAERGRELWVVDPGGGRVIVRYTYPHVDAGTFAVMLGDLVFAHRTEDFGIHEYRVGSR